MEELLQKEIDSQKGGQNTITNSLPISQQVS